MDRCSIHGPFAPDKRPIATLRAGQFSGSISKNSLEICCFTLRLTTVLQKSYDYRLGFAFSGPFQEVAKL